MELKQLTPWTLTAALVCGICPPAFAQDEESIPEEPNTAETSDEGNDSAEEAAEEAAEEPAEEQNEGAAEEDGTAEEETAPEDLEEAAEPPAEEPIEPAAEEPIAVEDPASQELGTTYSTEPAAAQSVPIESIEIPKLRPPSPFDQGRIRIGLGLGWASSERTEWLILGGGAGYNIFDGLEVGGDATFWVIGDPFIATVTPGVKYVLHFIPVVKPYVGAFYRHYFVASDRPDTDSIGARGGLYFMTGKMSYFGGGVVYEHFLDQDLFVDRDQFYPEITFALAF